METKRHETRSTQPVSAHTEQPSPVRRRLLRVRRSTILLSSAAVIVIIVVIANWPLAPGPKKTDQGTTQTASPQYETVLPSNKSIKDLGGWKKLTPPQSSPFYTYSDSVSGVAVNVSQQQLPKAFQANTNEKVAELAKGYNATKKLTVNGMTVYIGTSAKGPQSVIFTKDNLLVLIQSKSKIKDSNWKRYISSLGTPNSTDETTY